VNTVSGPFASLEARQAINWAIDRSEIVKLAFFGAAVEAAEAVSKPNPFYSGENFYSGGPDLDKAKALLAKANLASTDLVILVEQEDSSYALIAQVLVSQLEKIGLTPKIETASSAEYFGRLASQGYDLAITYFSASLDPALTYFLMGYSTSGFNFTGYKSPTVDAAIDAFTFEGDQAKRKTAYPIMVKTIQEESPFIFVANRLSEYWTKPTFGGAEVLPTLEVRVEEMWSGA
jgi:peptide/nickel transport system substrate-binding protein